MRFTKMEGCGNDYIYIEDERENIPQEEKPALVKRLSDRHFGIGGDGVIFIRTHIEGADFGMEMYNADGSRSEMCGNGIRCVGKYVYDHALTKKTELSVESMGKRKYLRLYAGDDGKIARVRVDMGAPELSAKRIPVNAAASQMADDRIIDERILVLGRSYRMTCVSMGNPHAVVFVDDVKGFPVAEVGAAFETHEAFPNRVNAEFARVADRENIEMRVFERGTGETLACGTGACATAVAAMLNGLTERRVTVHLRGGELEIEWEGEGASVYMTGPAAEVFSGEI